MQKEEKVIAKSVRMTKAEWQQVDLLRRRANRGRAIKARFTISGYIRAAFNGTLIDTSR